MAGKWFSGLTTHFNRTPSCHAVRDLNGGVYLADLTHYWRSFRWDVAGHITDPQPDRFGRKPPHEIVPPEPECTTEEAPWPSPSVSEKQSSS